MTALAYRDGVLAADTGVCGGYFRRGRTCKLARSPAGTIGGGSGHSSMCRTFRKWVESGEVDEWLKAGAKGKGPPIEAGENDFGAIVVSADGKVTPIDYHCMAVDLRAPFYVDGSAEAILLGALAAGATAAEAVAIAIEYDTGCGGTVQTMSLVNR